MVSLRGCQPSVMLNEGCGIQLSGPLAPPNRNRNLLISKALLKSQAHQGTSLFTRAVTNQRRQSSCYGGCRSDEEGE